MTDHLDEAATTAMGLVGALDEIPAEQLVGMMAQHLTYLAGLIRGGAVRPLDEPSVAVPMSDEERGVQMRFHPGGRIEFVDPTETVADEEADGRMATLGTVRAAVGADETLPYCDLVQRIRAFKLERDELLAAAKELLAADAVQVLLPPVDRLREVVERIGADRWPRTPP